MGDATLRLSRRWNPAVFGGHEQWTIAIDGVVVGSIASQETVELSVAPGHHTLRLAGGKHRSPERSFDAAQDDAVSFRCHGPRIWPMFLAALVRSDLWITLRPE